MTDRLLPNSVSQPTSLPVQSRRCRVIPGDVGMQRSSEGPASAFKRAMRAHFVGAIQRLKDARRYRVFIDLDRDAARFPTAIWRPNGSREQREVTIWCSNDYLRMGGHSKVRAAAVAAAEQHGAGAGGTRNISGTHHPIVELEAELADLHRKEAALVFTSGWVSNLASISTIASCCPTA